MIRPLHCDIISYMNTRILITVTDTQREQLRALYEREGISVTEQVRRAINLWLEEKERQHRILSKVAARAK
jgi:hypothetical protein